MIRMRASCDRARRISTRWRWPTDSEPTIWSAARSSISSEASSASALASHGAPVDPAAAGAGGVAEKRCSRPRSTRERAGAPGRSSRRRRAWRPRASRKAHSAPVDQDFPAVGLVHAGYNLDQGRLAGAVFAEQRVHLARAHIERDAAERPDAGERLFEVAHLEKRDGATSSAFMWPPSRGRPGRPRSSRRPLPVSWRARRPGPSVWVISAWMRSSGQTTRLPRGPNFERSTRTTSVRRA